MSRAVAVSELTKTWGDGHAVDEVSFGVSEGTLTVLLGPSGCGKSTTLRMIAGLEAPTAGTVEIGDRNVTDLDPADRGVSMVFQSYALFPHLTVAGNILFGLQVRGVSRAEQRTRLDAVAELVGLTELLERKPAALSGGQRQRVALARAIIAERPVCLMDEPLSNLDAKLRGSMRRELRRLQRELGMTMIYVTHDQTEAMTMADQIILMRDGRIEQAGTPRALYQTPATAFTAAFIGSPPMNVIPVTEDVRKLPGLAKAPDRWRFGIRPEDIKVGSGRYRARVEDVEHLGAESLVKLALGEHRLTARVANWTETLAGEEIALTWRKEDVHLFDAQGIRRDGVQAVPSVSAGGRPCGSESEHRSIDDASDVTHKELDKP